MAKFESTIREIQAPQKLVYSVLSNMSNIEKVIDRVPEDVRDKVTFTADGFAIQSPMGKVAAKVVDLEEPKTIKLQSVESPVPFNFWIQLLPVTEQTSKMKLTMKAELNIMMAQMVKGPLQKGIEQLADALQSLPYQQFGEL
ncbi:MAG: SRPBCC family protein [Prevotella sp.]|jgi:carbon monoxide dehydrogenase subunit G